MDPHSIIFEQSNSLTVDDNSENLDKYDAYSRVLANSIYTDNEFERRLHERFLELKESWIFDTKFESGYKAKINHPSYFRIVSFGEEIVPILLKDMVENETPWFYALTDITGENPIQPTSRGRINNMIEDWKNWANKNGLDV